jgi:Flp pilus assembly protein CpaB
VEISVSGAEALLAAGAAEPGVKVDVVVTTEPNASGAGRTYVAASAVPLLALGPGADGPGPGGAAAATLALTKPQALRLIAAESFARKLTLLPEG